MDIPTLDLFPRHFFLEQLQILPILDFRAAEDILTSSPRHRLSAPDLCSPKSQHPFQLVPSFILGGTEPGHRQWRTK